MRLLTLLRHAKSSQALPGEDDHERVLSHQGLLDAEYMAKRLLAQVGPPDIILCSSATRTRQTVESILSVHQLSSDTLVIQKALYLASSGTLLEHIQQCDPSKKHCLVVAHNPGLEMLGRQLHPQAPYTLATGGLLHFELAQKDYVFADARAIDLRYKDNPSSQQHHTPD